MRHIWKHLKTICKHKAIVFKECFACGLVWQGITHDLSKFSPTEFVSSAKYFQGTRSPIEAEKASVGYSAAWLHHKGRNRHHWEYWTDFGKNGEIIVNRIPRKYVIEMVCDWIGAGKAYNKLDTGDIFELGRHAEDDDWFCRDGKEKDDEHV